MINIAQADSLPDLPAPIVEAGAIMIVVFLALAVLLVGVAVLRNLSKTKVIASEVDAKERLIIMSFADEAIKLRERDSERERQITRLQAKLQFLRIEIGQLKDEVRTCVEIEEQNALLKQEIINLKQQNALLRQENKRLKDTQGV